MSWAEKYEILLKEDLLNKDINQIMRWTYQKTKDWKKELMLRLEDEGNPLSDHRFVPTELFLKEIGKDMKYFERKMKQEHELFKIKNEKKKIKNSN